MTTVAYNGKTLAGDTQATASALIRRVPTKVHKIEMPDGNFVLFGASGCDSDMHEVVAWIAGGMPDEKRPRFERDLFSGLFITRDGCFRFESNCRPLPVIEPFHALGNGRDFAIAAMHCGRDAREAVVIACKYDIYSSEPVTHVSFDD